MPIGNYKRTVESHVATTFKLGGTLAFGLTLTEPILAAAQPIVTLQAYVGTDEVACRPHDILYTDLIVTIVITKGCNYGSLKKWLAHNQMIPGAQAYTTVSNELVDIINTGIFSPDANKQKQKRGKKKGDEETVGAITEADEGSSPTNTLPTEFE